MNKNRALLLDRDGVINVDHGYVGTPTQFDFMPGLFPFLQTVRDRGYLLAVLTNQSGVARGKYSEKDHADVTAHMLTGFRRAGITIDLTLASFEHPEGSIAAYKRESFWRKPNPGMVLDAVRRLDLNPNASAFLGDHLRDMQAAQTGGIGTCLWLTQENPSPSQGIRIVRTYDEALHALNWI